MPVPVETAEKYSWTFLQYLRAGPRAFFAARTAHPEQYLSPAACLVCNLGLFILIHTLSIQIWHQAAITLGGETTGPALPPGSTAQINALIQVLALVISALIARLYFLWPLRAQADFKVLLDGEFYSSTLLVCFATIDVIIGLFAAAWTWLSSEPLSRLWPLVAFELLCVVITASLFHYATYSALAGIRVRRLIQAGLVWGSLWLIAWLIFGSILVLQAKGWIEAAVMLAICGVVATVLLKKVKGLQQQVLSEQIDSGVRKRSASTGVLMPTESHYTSPYPPAGED